MSKTRISQKSIFHANITMARGIARYHFQELFSQTINGWFIFERPNNVHLTSHRVNFKAPKFPIFDKTILMKKETREDLLPHAQKQACLPVHQNLVSSSKDEKKKKDESKNSNCLARDEKIELQFRRKERIAVCVYCSLCFYMHETEKITNICTKSSKQTHI